MYFQSTKFMIKTAKAVIYMHRYAHIQYAQMLQRNKNPHKKQIAFHTILHKEWFKNKTTTKNIS